ncbi:MAG: polyketide cyclase, partial [Chloroflexota bacterium]
MTERNTVKATFTIERTYPAKPARVFKAFADEASKRKWFGGGADGQHLEHAFDFRVDGVEVTIGRHASGVVSA